MESTVSTVLRMSGHNETMRPIASPAQAAATYRHLPQSSYDLVVIGGGSAGLSAANIARTLGASVALVDREKLGGECLYTGCVPSKALLHAAQVAATVRRAGSVGLHSALEPVDLSAVMAYVQGTIRHIYEESDAPEHLLARGIAVAFGDVRFVSPRALSLNGQAITAKHFLIATGSHPAVPPVPGLCETGFLTNETVFALRQLPRRLAVLGGGPIGCELGQAFARLGAEVIIFEMLDCILPQDDADASAVLHAHLVREGIRIATATTVTGVSPQDGMRVIAAQTSSGPVTEAVDEILVATGRAPNIEGLGLEAARVAFDPTCGITINAALRTSNPRIFAAGDVAGGYLFTHAAAVEARIAVRNALFPGNSKLDTRVMPWATFTEPEVAHVGLTEAQARRQYGNTVRVDSQPFTGVDRAVTEDAPSGFLKLISTSKGKLLGAEIVGPRAGDYINELALALAQRLTLTQIAATTHVYPTLALAIQQAASKYVTERVGQNAVLKLLRRLSG
jgi:pyruvate/2-oxoglutarate dehydrogenase complex dihydrolipoamide dehydrogenase (E3) component